MRARPSRPYASVTSNAGWSVCAMSASDRFAVPRVTRADTWPYASSWTATPWRSSSRRIARSARNSWYGAVGADATRSIVASVVSMSGMVKRGMRREDIVSGQCSVSTTRAGARSCRSVRAPVPSLSTSAVSRPTTRRTSVTRARSSRSTSSCAISRRAGDPFVMRRT